MLKTAGGGSGSTGAVSYQGTWNASTNTPTLTSSVGTQGSYYVVNVAGTTNLNGITDWQVGDWAIFNGTVWQKVDNTDAVTSVNGQTGTVVLGATDVGATPNTVYVLTSGLLSGGGRLTGNVTITLTSVPVANVTGAVPNTVNVLAGTGLSGGGALTGNVTLNLANTAVTAATYGNASYVSQVTIDAQGRITSATNVAIAIANSAVSGLGTMATQNANAVVITGGTINSTTQTNGTYANANITSVAVTFPNSYLANSSATLGNATITLGSTTSTVGNLTLNNVTVNSGNATFTNANATNSTITNFSSGNVTITGGTENAVTYTNVTINSGNVTVNNANLTYANVVTAIRTQALTGYLYGNANTGNVSAATTIPNANLANSTITLGNATLTLGSTTTSVGNLTLSNANITSVAATFPNSYLANSTVTLGNATLTLGGTTSTVGNLTLNNVTIGSGTFPANVVNVTSTTSSSATFATSSLPLVPAGYISVNLNGTVVKIPYYAV